MKQETITYNTSFKHELITTLFNYETNTHSELCNDAECYNKIHNCFLTIMLPSQMEIPFVSRSLPLNINLDKEFM